MGILQLIHHIYNAFEVSLRVDEFQDDRFFECVREGRSGDSTEILSHLQTLEVAMWMGRRIPKV